MKTIHVAAIAASAALVRDAEAPSDRMTRELSFDVRATSIDEESRTVELSFSSEEPYARWWGTEILDHRTASVRLGRLNDGGALLVDHNTRDQVGVVEKAWIKGRKGFAIVRFGKSARAEEIWQDVRDGIRKLVSVGYRIIELVLEKEKDGEATYRATDWEPYEISIVAVPADTTVGVGRDGKPEGFDPRTLISQEEDDMNMTRNDGGAAPALAAAPAAAQAPAAVATETRSAVPASVAPAIDPAAIQRAERERISNIRAMGDRLDCRDLADAAISGGHSLDQFVSDYQARAGNASALRAAESPAIGLTEREAQRFSITRMLAAMSDPTNVHLRNAAGFEFEASEAALQRGVAAAKPGAVRIPHDVLVAGRGEQRDLSVGTSTAGGNTVATDLLAGSFIYQLVNQMAVTQLGATFLNDLNGNIAIPRQTGGATVYWVAEGGAVTESQQSFDQVTLTPKTAGAFTDYSRQLLLQSAISVEDFVRRDLALRMALGIDLAAINGSGSSNQPRGVLNTSGIGSVAGGTNGLAPTWDNVIDLETQVAVANADMGAMGYLTNAKVRGKLKRTEKFSGTNGDPIWDRGTEPLNGYRAGVSNQVPANLTKGTSSGVCSAIVFGNWADLLIGAWGGLDVLVNPYINSGTGTVRIEVYQSVDVTVRHPESFAAMLDALTA